MVSDGKFSLPGGMGGLMRYDEEYKSKFMLKPEYVIIFLILIAAFVIGLKWFYPIATG
jgi:preprotein translocase subunit Sec61beta